MTYLAKVRQETKLTERPGKKKWMRKHVAGREVTRKMRNCVRKHLKITMI
uniref:Uncharacterized protein n=1 Tax=Picea sitchensis TaxID=3332 RepID=A9NSC7_PICSI|nr:unknown [Picea sitchensis]